jgi:hypothetical protein
MSNRVMVFDGTDRLTPIWSAGQHVGNFDNVIRATSWDNAADQLALIPDIAHLQFWGHGSPGRAYMSGQSMPYGWELCLHNKVGPESVIWFRMCSVFAGPTGIAFAERLARNLNANIVGHIRDISTPWPTHHSGGYAVRPNGQAQWKPTDGLKPGGGTRGSYPTTTHTCLATTMNVPTSWWS